MQLGHCCEIFDIFIFILVLYNEIPCEFLTLFPIHRVFAGIPLSVPFRTEHHSRYCCMHFDVHKMQFRGMMQREKRNIKKK